MSSPLTTLSFNFSVLAFAFSYSLLNVITVMICLKIELRYEFSLIAAQEKHTTHTQNDRVHQNFPPLLFLVLPNINIGSCIQLARSWWT